MSRRPRIKRPRKRRPSNPLPDLKALVAQLPRAEVAAMLIVSLVATGIGIESRVGQTPDGPRVELGFSLPWEWTPAQRQEFTAWVQPWVDDMAPLVYEADQANAVHAAARWN